MKFYVCIFLGFLVASLGSLSPSFLNLTVVKFSLKSGKKAAFYLIGGFATILFFQANIGAYFSSILMKNSEYITLIQKVGTAILFLLSANFFRLQYFTETSSKKVNINKSKSYLHGLGMCLLNMFAIPFYFTTLSFLIGLNYFEYTFLNALYFSIGSTLGSYTTYTAYAIVAKKVENRLKKIATKMDLILALLTGVVAIGNAIYLITK